jgi:hypothetical protein
MPSRMREKQKYSYVDDIAGETPSRIRVKWTYCFLGGSMEEGQAL